jgi:hypothetical protein
MHVFDRGFWKNIRPGSFLIREILFPMKITLRGCKEPGKGARFEIAVPKKQCRFPHIVKK